VRHIHGDAVQIAPETCPRLVTRNIAQQRQKTLLRQLFRSRGIAQPAPEKAVDRIAVALEKLAERVPRTLLELEDQLIVGIHVFLHY